MSKRSAEDGGNGTSQPPIKKVHFEPHLIGPVSTLEEMDIKVLQFQNKKLAQRIEQRHRCEAELRARIEQLEKRQTQDDAVLCVVNRYWNLLNEDIRVLLQRFDAETADESENKNENEATTSFLMQLSTWDKEELDAQLANRVQVSKRAVAKVLQAFDRLQQRNDKIWRAIKGEGEEGAPAPSLDEVVRATNEEVTAENRRLQAICTTLQENHHAMTLRVAQLQDAVNSRDTENAELKNQIDDLQYELMKVRSRNDKLENHLAEAIEKLKSYHQSGASASSSNSASTGGTPLTAAAAAKLEDVAAELEEQRELANNRLAELDRLHRQHRDMLKEVEKLKMDIRQLPESVIVETTEYKCLQSQFSVLYNESMQMKTALDETRMQLQNAKNLHMRQIEMMESEELARQKALRAEMIQLEDVLGQLRKEYEMLRIEFEQNLAANEQTGPINREMRHLITSLQNHNQQLKGEVSRYKRKYKDTSQELNKLRKETEEAAARGGASTSGEQPDEKPPPVKKEEPDPDGEDQGGGVGGVGCVGGVGAEKPASKEQARGKLHEQELIIKELKQQLKKAVNEQKELKLLLDMYKGVSKEQRDKVQLMAAERKARQELEDHRQKAKMAQESKRERRMADEDALRKIKQLEEQKYELQKQLSCARPNADPLHAFSRPFAGSQEEEALLNEMEVTGQAFEDMQEQNSRLIQQLREKDDANFKLMSERIKANSLHKLLREEKQLLHEKVVTRDQQIESMGAVARRLEEKERLLQATLSAVEKELLLRQQAMEMHKRKAIESAQSAADLKLHLEKYHAQMKEAQQVVAEKTSALEAEAYKTKRLHEELAILRRKAERMKKMEQAGSSMDEVLLEEIRDYKETLTCPSCKVKRKDAVLTKCFHVFCWDCLRTRYETRQRKCPKCNAAFGANDYHRLYLST
ncbi:PREDICTED: E3 ubiquitin-protein ligase BRE1B [Papilio xuthus]|uniref:E3 ubiquitin protein ligase n=1 Tax=Papilio xuthus TaxID=66420 RepID=A0AAJ7EKB7_PAPXU|nr:PREDICTED: E3 ubiquitin-protein ligase BRE1B [Papilio xuthus]XP_013180605.1 PREDICTED: E3 ubiquitin-protein ligase BRE1B [Papilio xuthus]XP_013180606.1 PREDICTED: E3 ubiquitin-protein ligase BRE1B [Papilio xuthus]